MIYQSEKRVSSLVRRLLWPVARSSIWNSYHMQFYVSQKAPTVCGRCAPNKGVLVYY
jgi:hypothetical protein